MARLDTKMTRAIGVAVSALVATALPTATVDVARADTSTAPGVVFYTPLDGGTTPGTFHVMLGAAPTVTSVDLEYTSTAGTVSLPITQTITRKPGSDVFETSSPPLSGTVQLLATARDTDDAVVGTPVVETVTVGSSTRFDFIRPRTDPKTHNLVPLGVFKRVDGHVFARTSGSTTGTVEPVAVDPAADPTVVVPPARFANPTGTFDGGIFREPVDLSQHRGLTLPGRAVIRVGDGTSSEAVEAPLYLQKVTSVTASTTPVPGSRNVTVTVQVTDQTGQPVVGVPVRLGGYASGSSTPANQLAATDVNGAVTFTGPGTGSGPTVATGYPTGFYTTYADLNIDGRRGGSEPGYVSVVGTVSAGAPGKSLFHSDARIRNAGGVLNDSLRGTRLAAARRYQWIDQDGQLSFTSRAGRRAGVSRVSQPGHLTWVNAHGAPYNPRWLGRGRFENRTWANLRKRPGLRNAETTFQQDAAHRLSVEWEVKDIKPFTSATALNAAFANLAAAAQRYYGSAWRSRVEVKMLSNLSGGQAFALRVLQVAHAHGFTTIYLARGAATGRQIPASAHAYVTYVRGARAGLYAPFRSSGRLG